MLEILTICALLLFYFVAQEAVRRSPVILTWGLFALVPAVLSNYWLRINNFDPFLWTKIYSMMVCICWATWMRFNTGEHTPLIKSSIVILLAANVLEATVVDLWASGLSHRLNAVTGMLLIATLPFGVAQVSVDQQHGYKDLHVKLPRSWIVGYSLWNWTFVYLNYPGWAGHHVAVLLAALLVGLIEPKRWVQARACTLGISLLFTATSYKNTLSIVNTEYFQNAQFALTMAALSLAWVVGHAVNFKQNVGHGWQVPERKAMGVVEPKY